MREAAYKEKNLRSAAEKVTCMGRPMSRKPPALLSGAQLEATV